MKIKIVFIIVSMLLMIGLVLFIALDRENQQYRKFNQDGYILSSYNSGNSNMSIKYYFSADAKYKNKYPSNIVFTDIDGKEVVVEKNGIIHYVDNSLSVLKKSVIINVDELNNQTLKYYNIFDQTVLENKKGIYTVNNAGKKVTFSDFVMKISDTKFLLVSNSLKLKTKDIEKSISGYLELNITDGDIIRLENQEVSLQTIATDAYIMIGEKVKLDLSNNKIYYDNKEKFSLQQLVIDSDDNIPIVPDQEAEEDNKNNTDVVNAGNGNDEYEDDNKENEDLAHLPTFSVINMHITSNKIDATIKITDDSNILMGSIMTKIIESSSGKLVYSKEETSGTYSLDILVENLEPNTSYTLIINSDYIKNGVTYNRDFLIKSFRTELLGIELIKNYYTKNSLSFFVKTESYSNIKSAEVILMDSNNQVLKKITIDGEFAKSEVEVTFNELVANTTYKVVVTNFLYDGVIISNGFEIEQECKTLKNKPTFGTPSFIIDKKNGVFTLKVNNVSDLDNGIENYKYEIYDARAISGNDVTPISVVEKNRITSIDLPVDETSVFRGIPYTFKIIAEFYDNEKYIEYESEYSSVFKMDGVQFPTLQFEPNNITFEKIEGNLVIIDEGNTISLGSNLITVVYTNSTGNSKTFTTSGNLSIPFSVNNLRANETYTISVYTTINLQDGNQAIDNCFIGSVIVKTAETKQVTANYNINTNNVTNAFSVTTILGTSVGIDNILEANTLTGIIFNLYAGQTTSGTLVKSVKKVDRNLAPYSSDLKEQYYDKSFLITPEFFGVSNNDMQEEYYTIEITGAYDYTDYKNNIPIVNQTIIVKSNGFIPDLPPDPNAAIEVNVIRNKDTADHYRSDLNADTIVGYRIKGGYNNSRLYAKYLKYYIYDANTNMPLNPEGTTVLVDETGVINYAEFYLGYGTSYGTIDNDFRRGNNYYFVYEAHLDLNFDGIAESVYPYQSGDSNIILKSPIISPAKQEPIFKIYPSISTNNTMNLKYMFSDVDNALVTDTFYAKIGGVEKSSVDIQKGTTDYNTAVLKSLSKGYLGVEVSQALIKQASAVKRKNLMYQYFDSVFSMKQLSFHTVIDVNRLIISIIDYDANITNTSRIAALKVTFTSGTTTIVKDNLPLDYDSVIIDLADIKDFVGMDVSISVQAYYDTGITGFDIPSSKLALQTIMTDGIGGEYLTINNSNNLRGDVIANGSIYDLDFASNSITLKNLSSERQKTIMTNCDAQGISFNYEYLLAKKLDLVTLSGDGTELIRFNTIIPGVSLLNIEERLNIVTTLRTAQINLKFYGANASQVKDNKFYVELYETNEAGTTSVFIRSVEVNIAGIDNVITLDNLNPKSQYFIKLFADVYNGTEFIKTQLYDVDFKINTKLYYFTTLSVVGVSNVNVRYTATTYNNKNIRVTYNLSEIVGYDKIKYNLYHYKKDANGVVQKVIVDENVTDDIVFNRNMVKNIPSPPGSDFVFGDSYNLVIIPIAYITIDGEQIELELDDEISYDFTLDQLRSPFIGIVGTATNNLGLEFKISIYDIHKVIVNGTYTIKILDYNDNDITPIEYKYQEYNINTLNNTFTLSELDRDREYKVIVTTYIDRKNNMIDVEKLDTLYTKSTLNDSGIDIGDLYTTMNSINKSKVDLLFYNSYKLTYITEIRYSIYNFSGYAQDGSIPFIPTQMTSPDGNYYLFTLPDILPSGGLYYIELQFIYEGRIVAETSIEHNCVD